MSDDVNFDLVIQRSGAEYLAVVVRSPAGEGSSTFKLPFSESELQHFRSHFGHRQGGLGESGDSVLEAAKAFGGRLFAGVFNNDMQQLLSTSLSEAGDNKRLRIRLQLSDVPELADLPWEYLYDPDLGFLSRSSRTPIVRYVDLRRPSRTLGIELPLRILVMISSPHDYPSLDVEKEWSKLNRSLKQLIDRRMVELVLLEEATIPALLDQFRKSPFHVFHFIGHGGYDSATGDGYLVFEEAQDDEGIQREGRRVGSRRVNGERVANLLQNHGSLRLAVINACEGEPVSMANPFGEVARSLVRASIPAVVAMQFSLTDDAAIHFAAEFYKRMAEYSPVDAALADARIIMNDAEWGAPVLYMRSPDGQIFGPLLPVSRDFKASTTFGPRPPAEIFISYAREDRDRVGPIAQALEEHGYSVWWDQRIVPGKNFDQMIEDALDSAKCVIVVWSKQSISSHWVKTEANEGREKNILIPVLIENIKLPLAFRRIQAASLIDWQGEKSHPGLQSMLDAVKVVITEHKSD